MTKKELENILLGDSETVPGYIEVNTLDWKVKVYSANGRELGTLRFDTYLQLDIEDKRIKTKESPFYKEERYLTKTYALTLRGIEDVRDRRKSIWRS